MKLPCCRDWHHQQSAQKVIVWCPGAPSPREARTQRKSYTNSRVHQPTTVPTAWLSVLSPREVWRPKLKTYWVEGHQPMTVPISWLSAPPPRDARLNWNQDWPKYSLQEIKKTCGRSPFQPDLKRPSPDTETSPAEDPQQPRKGPKAVILAAETQRPWREDTSGQDDNPSSRPVQKSLPQTLTSDGHPTLCHVHADACTLTLHPCKPTASRATAVNPNSFWSCSRIGTPQSL